MKPILAIPATSLLVYRAWSRNSLTPVGIIVAGLTAIVHAAHPSPVPFALLVVFFLGGTRMTKIKHDVKSRLTVSSTGAAGGDGPRTHIQVLANSAAASILILLHIRQLHLNKDRHPSCFAYGGDDILMVGIVANYAATAADTFSSELGILSKGSPRLITSLTLRRVPPGTNGGVTLVGVLAGALGAFTIALTSLMLPFCPVDSSSSLAGFQVSGLDGGKAWGWREKTLWVAAVTIWGTLGSLLDSILGGLLQATVVDKQTGKVVEGSGGQKVLIHAGSVTATGLGEVPMRQGSQVRVAEDIANALTPRRSHVHEKDVASIDAEHESRKVESGYNVLDNNAINLLMASIMSIGGMVVAGFIWDTPLQSNII